MPAHCPLPAVPAAFPQPLLFSLSGFNKNKQKPLFFSFKKQTRFLFSRSLAQTHSRAADAMGLIAFLPNASDSESSREKSEKKFDPFLSSGTTLVSKSAERLFYVAALVTGPR